MNQPATQTAPRPAPPPTATSTWLAVERSPDARVFAAVAVGAVLTDLAVRSGFVGVAGALLVAASAAALLAAGRPRNRQAWVLAAAAPLFGVWLAFRTSPWLIPLDVLSALGLLLLAGLLAQRGSVFDLPPVKLAASALFAAAHAVAAPGFLARTSSPASPSEVPARPGGTGLARRTRSVLVGLALAVPVVGVFGALLASADPVFANFFDPADLVRHVLLLVLGAWAVGGLLRLCVARAAPEPRPDLRWLDPMGALVVLGALDALFAAFALAQLVALGEGGKRVLRTAGLTWAEYARSGFFQLLAVAALTIVVLLTLVVWTRQGSPRARRWVLALGELTVALTLVLVVVAYRRLDLYVDVFGLTMLRLFSQLFTLWVGLVLCLLGARLAGVWPRRSWLGPSAAVAGLAILLVLNAVNPEAIVVRHNLEAAPRLERFDPEYLGQLSDDAVATLVDALPGLSESERQRALTGLGCSDPAPEGGHQGWAAFNLARSQAEAARARACGGQPSP